MPFEGPNDAGLSASVKKLPVQKRRQFVAVFNSVFSKCRQGGGTVKFCEGRAFPQAYGAVKEMTMEEKPEEETQDKNCGPVMMIEEAPKPFGGAVTIGDAQAHESTIDAHLEADRIWRMYDGVAENIRNDEGMLEDAKVVATKTALDDAGTLLQGIKVGQRSLIGKIKAIFTPSREKISTVAKKERAAFGQRGTFRAFKDLAGVWRWFSVTTNKYKDREKEIFSDASHKDYVAFVDREKAYPELWLWHVPGSRIGVADFVDYTDGFVVHSGTFDDDKVAQGFAEGGCEGLAVSHGFKYHPGDKEDGVYDWYRTEEVSVLPAEKAANVWTHFQTGSSSKEDSMSLSKERREFLVGRIGEEATADIEGDLSSMAKKLDDAGIEFKEFVQTPDEKPEAKLEEKPAADAKTETPSVEDRLAVLEAALTKGVKEAVDGLKETIVGDLGKLVDDKIAAALSPNRSAPSGDERPSQSKETEVTGEEAEKLKKETQEDEDSVHPYVKDLMRAGGGQLPRGSQ